MTTEEEKLSLVKVSNYGSDENHSKAAKTVWKYNLFHLFRYADRYDIALMVLGVILAIMQGAAAPLSRYFYFYPIIDITLSYQEHLNKNNSTLSLRNGNYSLFNQVGPICGYYALTGLAIFISSCLHIALWTIAGQRQMFRIRSRLFRSILAKDISWLDSQRVGALNNTMFENVRKLNEGLSANVSISLSWLAVAISSLVVAFVINWNVAIVVCSLCPLQFVTDYFMLRMMYGYGLKQSLAYSKAGSVACEAFGNIRTVIAFNKQEHELERYSRKLEPVERMGTFKTTLYGISQGISGLIWHVLIGLSFWYSARLGFTDSSGVVLIAFCLMMATSALAKASPHLASVSVALAAGEEVFSIIESSAVIDNFSEKGAKLEKINGKIDYDSVYFSYPTNRTIPVLKSFSVTISQGQTLAIVGRSGCGKSTAAQLLMRFFDATAGRITIDGIDVKLLNVKWLRQQIGYVKQEPVLFNMTIQENVMLGLSDYQQSCNSSNDEAITKACRLANAHDFILALPDGYNTVVGERGALLSGGQKQRIAIARALVSNPPILVLDEATSALDAQGEKLVQAVLDKARLARTTIVIAHRLSAIRNADLIAVVDNGNVVELGKHDDLMSKRGKYYDLVKTQIEGQNKTSDRKFADSSLEEDATLSVHSKNVEIEGYDTNLSTFLDVSRLETFKAVLRWGRPEAIFTIICSIVSAMTAWGQPAYAWLVTAFLNSLHNSSEISAQNEVILHLFIGITLLGIFLAILLATQHFLFALIGERLTGRMRRRVFGKILCMDAKWLDQPGNQSSILTTILASDCNDIQGLSGIRISIVVMLLTVLGTAVTYSLILEYRTTLLLLPLLPPIIIATVVQNKISLNASVGDSNNKNLVTVAMDAIGNMRTVMALTAEEFFFRRFEKYLEEDRIRAIKAGVLVSPIFSFVMPAVLWSGAISFSMGSWLMEKEDGGVTFNQIAQIYLVITFAGLDMARSSLSSIESYDVAEKASANLKKILSKEVTIDKLDPETFESVAAQEMTSNRLPVTKTLGRIDFDNVCFSYPLRKKVLVLKNVSFSVEPGQHFALCGPSGGGKSTIMQLLLRFYDVNAGRVLVDGVDVRQWNVRALRAAIGLVAQEPLLFGVSIRENIAYGLPDYHQTNDLDIEKVCCHANAFEFISQLPNGLDSNVGERGVQLSGGQKQRIAIARALIRNPPILLFDEATSALDTENEQIVQNAIHSASEGRTSLTIAHRLSTIKSASKIVVISDGRIAEHGTHDQLIALHAIYYCMRNANNGTVS